MFVKVCGLRTARDVEAAVRAGADAVGFLLTTSPRQVTPAEAAALAEQVPPHVLTVAVFAGEPPETVHAEATKAGVRAIQLHGDHPAADFATLRERLDAKLIRAVAGASGAPLECGAYGEDILIVDAPIPGSGHTWDTSGLAPTGHWLLAGGLTAENVGAAVSAVRPWGVDVSSGVEVARGVKDPALIARFVAAAKAA